MAITKAKKAEILTELTAAIKQATSAVLVSFTKLTVKEADELRAALKKEGMRYKVVKKTLLSKSLKDAGISGDEPALVGEVALVYLPKDAGEDSTAPARGIQEFVKKFKDKLVFLGGVMDGAFASREAIVAIATIPPVSVLRGMFVNVINSPIQKFAIGLGEVAKKKV